MKTKTRLVLKSQNNDRRKRNNNLVISIMKISKTNGCEVKSTNSTIKVETVNVKGKDIKVFTTEKGSKVQFLENYIAPTRIDKSHKVVRRVFCVYNKDFTKRFFIIQTDVEYWLEGKEDPFIFNEKKDTVIPIDGNTLVGQYVWIKDVPTFEEWSEVILEENDNYNEENENHGFKDKNYYWWYDSYLESVEEMNMNNPKMEGVYIYKDC